MSVHGNISHAMRDNYNEFGVDEYYRKVSATYRNPFYPSVKQTIWAIMNRWWTQEGQALGRPIRILDLAAGSGEVTECLLSWQATGQKTGLAPLPQQSAPSQVNGRAPFIPPKIARQRASAQDDPPSLHAGSLLDIVATDPFTVEAYTTRTSRTCHPLSFSDLASGQMPPETQDSTDGVPTWDLIICSFALHLVPTPSELFALMYELSNKAAWFIVIAPHKKPEIKEAWGWTRWDISNWNPSSDNSASGKLGSGSEIIRDKTRLRLYKSLSCESAPVALDTA